MDNLPPGLAGFVAGNQFTNQTNSANLQQATGVMGLLDHIRKIKQEEQLRGILSSPEFHSAPPQVQQSTLMQIPGGLSVLKSLGEIQNVQSQGALRTAQTREAEQKVQTEQRQQGFLGALQGQLTQSQYQGETSPGGPNPNLFQNDAEAIKAMQAAEAQGLPFRGDVNNPGVTRALVAGAGTALPARSGAEILKGLTPPDSKIIAGSARQVAGGYLEKQPDGSDKFISTRADPKSPSGDNVDSSGELSKDAIRNKAIQGLYDRNANIGLNRDSRTIKLITNAQAEIMKELGISPNDVISGQAGVKADTASLVKQTAQYDAVTAFEKNAIRNGETLVKLADKVDSTGIPVVERWLRAGKKAIAGDTDVAAFNAQIQVYRTEAARILTNPNLTGVLSDNARHEVEGFLSGNDSAPQIRNVVKLLTSDFENRRTTLEQQIQDTRKRLGSRMAPGADATSVKPTVQTNTAPQAALEYLKSNPGTKDAFKAKFGYLPEGM